MSVIQSLQLVVSTLNNIEVKGEQNLNAMLGSIQVLNSIIRDLSKESEVPKDGG